MTTAARGWIDQAEVRSRESLLGNMAGGRMSVYVKKFEILQKETSNSTALRDSVPIIMDLITCDLNVDKVLRQSLLQNLVQMVVSSESVVQKLSVAWKTDVLMVNLLRVMREHVMTQFKHYQLYTHGVIPVMKSLARFMKKNKTKESQFINSLYLVGEDSCTILDVLLKPMQYLVTMNSMFNDLGCMLLDHEDMKYLREIKRYMTQVFNKIQKKLDLVLNIVDEIVKRHESRCEKNRSADEKWKIIKEKLKKMLKIVFVKPCSFTLNLYSNFYFPDEQQLNEYLNTLTKY